MALSDLESIDFTLESGPAAVPRKCPIPIETGAAAVPRDGPLRFSAYRFYALNGTRRGTPKWPFPLETGPAAVRPSPFKKQIKKQLMLR